MCFLRPLHTLFSCESTLLMQNDKVRACVRIIKNLKIVTAWNPTTGKDLLNLGTCVAAQVTCP